MARVGAGGPVVFSSIVNLGHKGLILVFVDRWGRLWYWPMWFPSPTTSRDTLNTRWLLLTTGTSRSTFWTRQKWRTMSCTGTCTMDFCTPWCCSWSLCSCSSTWTSDWCGRFRRARSNGRLYNSDKRRSRTWPLFRCASCWCSSSVEPRRWLSMSLIPWILMPSRTRPTSSSWWLPICWWFSIPHVTLSSIVCSARSSAPSWWPCVGAGVPPTEPSCWPRPKCQKSTKWPPREKSTSHAATHMLFCKPTRVHSLADRPPCNYPNKNYQDNSWRRSNKCLKLMRFIQFSAARRPLLLSGTSIKARKARRHLCMCNNLHAVSWHGFGTTQKHPNEYKPEDVKHGPLKEACRIRSNSKKAKNPNIMKLARRL